MRVAYRVKANETEEYYGGASKDATGPVGQERLIVGHVYVRKPCASKAGPGLHQGWSIQWQGQLTAVTKSNTLWWL